MSTHVASHGATDGDGRPDDVDEQAIEEKVQDGVLEVRLSKTAEPGNGRRTIEVH